MKVEKVNYGTFGGITKSILLLLAAAIAVGVAVSSYRSYGPSGLTLQGLWTWIKSNGFDEWAIFGSVVLVAGSTAVIGMSERARRFENRKISEFGPEQTMKSDTLILLVKGIEEHRQVALFRSGICAGLFPRRSPSSTTASILCWKAEGLSVRNGLRVTRRELWK